MNNRHKLKLKLGRRAAYLRKCIRVNELLNKYESSTSIRVRVFTEYIKPVVPVSYTAFNNMLNESNPVKQLELIEEKIKNLQK